MKRLISRISKPHMNPNGFQKIKVSLAAQIFSNSVACDIEILVTFYYLSANAVHTSVFISNIDKLFDISNSVGFNSKKLLNRPFQGS